MNIVNCHEVLLIISRALHGFQITFLMEVNVAERTIDVPEALGLSEGHDPRDIIKSLSLGFIFGQAMSALISEEYDAKKFEDLVERLVMEKVGVKIPVTEETITEDMCRAVVNIFNKLGPEIINISR